MVDIIEYSIEMRKKKALIFYKHRRQKNIKRKRKLQPHHRNAPNAFTLWPPPPISDFYFN